MNTLTLEFWTEHNDFCMYAESDSYEQELKLEGQAREIVSQFHTLYDILEEKRINKQREFEQTIERLSALVLEPFIEPLRQCGLVRIIVYEDLIRCAFDLLRFDGNYLFLQRRVCYQVDEGTGQDAPSIELTSALLIADLSADPEKACLQVSKLIPDSEYATVEHATLSMIQKAADQVDALVISAHGDLEDDNSGGLWVNDDEMLGANLIAKTEAWIVYFDSCGMGANMSYLDAFQNKSDTQFYLAPLFSNDAGDSSTRTMVWFFTGVMQNKNPIRSLHETRKRLYDYYAREEKLDLVTTMNKAYVFRLYEFVD